VCLSSVSFIKLVYNLQFGGVNSVSNDAGDGVMHGNSWGQRTLQLAKPWTTPVKVTNLLEGLL
jgi:hypothetical protein